MSRAKVLLAEDSPVVARQLRTLLGQDFDVLAMVTDGASIPTAVDALHPDVLVTDISMPGMPGRPGVRAGRGPPTAGGGPAGDAGAGSDGQGVARVVAVRGLGGLDQ